jgi:cytochrome c biogenesis protein CcmG/thiol:disulfide interchange protein DsbE
MDGSEGRRGPASWLRWLLVPIVALPLGWLLLSGFGRDPRETTSPLIGRPAPDWSLTALDGTQVSSDDLAGRPYVVNFWASWCGPCVDEHPVLAGTQAALGDELAMVGVLYQDGTDDARAFLDRYGATGYPHLVDDDGRLAIEFGVTGPPETFFVDADGIVRDRQFGPLTGELMDLRLAALGLDR